jgi:copper(I)-binding protein
MLRSIALASALLTVVTTAAAAQSMPSPIAVENAWARATPGNSKTGVVYLTVVDHGTASDRLVGVSSPVAARAELHSMSDDNGVMKMHTVDAIPVQPGMSTELKPGGYHIMLMDLKQPLKEGGSFPLTLRFEKAGSVPVTVKVEKVGAMAPMPDMKPGMKM